MTRTDAYLWFILSLWLLLASVGCSVFGPQPEPGWIEYNLTEQDEAVTRTVTVRATNDGNPAGGTRLKLSPDGAVEGSTGSTHGVDQALEQLSFMPWVGVGLIVFGGLSIVARAWFPIIPISASIVCVAGGAALVWMPVFIDRITGWGLVALIVGGVVVFYGPALIDNWRKLHDGEERKAKRKETA